MSEERTPDMNDPHEAHAVFALEFRCEACSKKLPFQSAEEPYSDRWYSELAHLAKEKKWFAPPADPDGKMDVMRTWCPDCAAALGLALEGKSLTSHQSQRPPSDYFRI
jgi:hypothetical protein